MQLYSPTLIVLLLIFTSCSSNSVQDEEALFENEETAIEQTNLSITAAETDLFNEVNEYRIENGLSELAFSAETYKYAEEHTQFMIEENSISHDNFNDRAAQIAGETGAIQVAENVAKNYPEAKLALQGWLKSGSHKSTIEGDYTHTAIAIRENSKGKLFYTQIFLKK